MTTSRRHSSTRKLKLEILLGEPSELKLAIRDRIRSMVGVCPEHGDVPDAIAMAMDLAESALLQAFTMTEQYARATSRAEFEQDVAHQLESLEEALKALRGGHEHLGQKQAFVLRAINYAATQVPVSRTKLAQEVVLYGIWKVGNAPFEIFGSREARAAVTRVVETWRKAGGRGRGRWAPAQDFLRSFGLAAKNAAALKETAERYGIAYGPPVFQPNSHEMTLDEFDIISGRITGCPCCQPEQCSTFSAER